MYEASWFPLFLSNTQVQDFIDRITNHTSFYGFQPETLPSLVLSLLPPQMHNYEPLKDSSVVNSGLDIKVLLIQELVWNLRRCAGFHISPVSTTRLMAVEPSFSCG